MVEKEEGVGDVGDEGRLDLSGHFLDVDEHLSSEEEDEVLLPPSERPDNFYYAEDSDEEFVDVAEKRRYHDHNDNAAHEALSKVKKPKVKATSWRLLRNVLRSKTAFVKEHLEYHKLTLEEKTDQALELAQLQMLEKRCEEVLPRAVLWCPNTIWSLLNKT